MSTLCSRASQSSTDFEEREPGGRRTGREMHLSRIRDYALSLPETTEEPHFHRTSFRVRGRIFVTAIPGEPFINVFVGDDVREPALAMFSEWATKLMWGKKAVGLRIDLTSAEADAVNELIRKAWEAGAPKSLR